MSPTGITHDDEGHEVRAGHWEADDDGGFIVDADADAWRPSNARALAIQRLQSGRGAANPPFLRRVPAEPAAQPSSRP